MLKGKPILFPNTRNLIQKEGVVSIRMQKSLARRIAALELTRGPRRCFHFWDDQDGQVQLEIAAMKESGEIGDGNEVRIFSWMPAAPASGAPDDSRASGIPQ
jgi:hypothetical protein